MSSLAERSYLSIGQVVNLLRGTYPDLSNSKIRFLEDEGLITPHRTPKGYRQYSKADVDRLEVILHLQKTRYMPLSAIKQKLDSASDLSTLAFEVGLLTDAPMKVASKETRQKLHPIEDVPDILGVDIAFLRQLSDNDLIRIVRSPQNRELIDGRDFEIIRHCAELSRFHIEPRNLRQYVNAANRESALFEQVLIGMLGTDDSDDNREAKLDRAFKTLHDLTDGVRTCLLYTSMPCDNVGARARVSSSRQSSMIPSWTTSLRFGLPALKSILSSPIEPVEFFPMHLRR